MQIASHLRRISSGIKLLVFGPRFHGARQTFEWTRTCIGPSFVYTGLTKNHASFWTTNSQSVTGKRKGIWTGLTAHEGEGRKFPSLPPSLLRAPRVLSLPKSPSLPFRTPAMQGNLQQNLHGSVWTGCTGKKFVRWKVWNVWPDLCKSVSLFSVW